MPNNSEWSGRIRDAYRQQTGDARLVRFPESGIQIRGDEDEATIHLTDRAVTQNMQTNAAAFEGWALALIRWCKVRRIIISWDDPDDYFKTDTKKLRTRALHYNRFLYRVEQFSELLKDSVKVAHPSRLKRTAYQMASSLCLNFGTGSDTASIQSTTPEAMLEKGIVSNGIKKFEIESSRLDRQFPVGVFNKVVSKKTAIFSGNKSAIDLLGLDRSGGLWIFELKAEGNSQVGSISELFFYSTLLRDVFRRDSRFSPLNVSSRAKLKPADFQGIQRIHACLLAPEAHPLIDYALLDILNSAARKRQWQIDYQYADLKDI